MIARQSLLDWLRIGAARMRTQRRLDAVARAAALLAALVLGNALVTRLVSHPAPASALRVLSLLVAVTLLGLLIWRLRARASLQEAAGAADSRAGLADTLTSAHWFAIRESDGAFVERHLQRAADTARGLNPHKLFPLRLPRASGAAAALTIAALAVILLPAPGVDSASDNTFASPPAASRHQAGSPEQARARGGDPAGTQAEAARRNPNGVPTAEVERDAAAAAAGEASPSPAGAAGATNDDTRTGAGVSTGSSAVNAPGDQMNQTLAKSILERLAQLMSSESSQSDPVRDGQAQAAAATGSLERALRREQDDAQQSATRDNKPGEDALNTSLRALSRTGMSGEDKVHGEANATDGGSANVGEGAMGRRIGVSRAGAGEGDQPVGNLIPPEEGDNVLGRRTERLEAQLRRGARVQSDAPRTGEEGQVDPEESLYAATRAQTARAAFRPSEAAQRAGAETPGDARRVPLELREAVKRYTLARHRREPAPERPDTAAR